MAAFVIKSLVSQITVKHSPSDHTSSIIEIKSALISVKRRCGSKIPVLAASIHSENDQSIQAQKKKNGNAKNIQSNLLQDAEYDVASKDAHPRPLSSTHLSNSVSNGSCLRVAYQGVRGAYSESAAQKAYPNCEAVPCEQFDTAFEVNS